MQLKIMVQIEYVEQNNKTAGNIRRKMNRLSFLKFCQHFLKTTIFTAHEKQNENI